MAAGAAVAVAARGGGGVRSGWWLGNGLRRVSSVIAQPRRWGSYFLFSVSVSPDAGTAHVGTRSFLAPGWVGETHRG